MHDRFSPWALFLVALVLPLAGCTGTSMVDSISVSPAAPASINVGQQVQFTATGTYTHASPHPPTYQDVTDMATWTSSDTTVAKVSSTGLATAMGQGTATITASINGFSGLLTSSATLTVTITQTGGCTSGTGTCTSNELLLSINIIPGNATVSNQGMTAQYLAFGTFSTPPLMRDITNEVTWISSFPEVASIYSGGTPGEAAGLATAEGYTGISTIYAEDTKTNPDGTVVLSNSQTFTCKDPETDACDTQIALPQFATLTVYAEGESTFVPNMSQIGPDKLPYGEYLTAPSDTGTPNLIHCDGSDSSPGWLAGATTSQWTTVGGTGGVVCVGTYAVNSTVTLTQNLPANSTYFGGWSTGTAETLSCTIVAGAGATPSNTCTSISQNPAFTDPNNPPSGWFCSTSTTGTGTTAVSTSSCYEPIPCTWAPGYNSTNSPTCTLPLLGNATVGVIFY